MSNKGLKAAKERRDDEFYTRYEDIEKELGYYKPQFENKIIYMPCDDPRWSNFWKFMHEHFAEYKLKKIICSFITQTNESPFILEYSGGVDNDITAGHVIPLHGDGDFRSPELMPYWENCDIVVTNPPFSLVYDFINTINTFNKDMLIISRCTTINTNKSICDLFLSRYIKIGYNFINKFIHNEKEDAVGSVWLTTLSTFEAPLLELTECYSAEKYPKYDNYNAIEVSSYKLIPKDYYGIMGIPTTSLRYVNTSQFELIGITYKSSVDYIDVGHVDGTSYNAVLNGKEKFSRLFIRRR